MSSILKRAKDLLSTDFVLCYKDPHSQHWSCETGYETMQEVNNRTQQLSQTKTTTVLTTYHGTPSFIRQQWIKKQLTPTIIIQGKPNN